MSLLTRCPIPSKIDNTYTSTHIASTFTCMEKDPVSNTDCNSRILFLFYLSCGYFLSTTVLTRILIIF